MLPPFYVAPGLCCPKSVLPQVCVAPSLCCPRSVLPPVCVAPGLCCPKSVLPQVCVAPGLCCPRSTFPQVSYEPHQPHSPKDFIAETGQNTGLCCPRSVLPQVCVAPGLCFASFSLRYVIKAAHIKGLYCRKSTKYSLLTKLSCSKIEKGTNHKIIINN